MVKSHFSTPDLGDCRVGCVCQWGTRDSDFHLLPFSQLQQINVNKPAKVTYFHRAVSALIRAPPTAAADNITTPEDSSRGVTILHPRPYCCGTPPPAFVYVTADFRVRLRGPSAAAITTAGDAMSSD